MPIRRSVDRRLLLIVSALLIVVAVLATPSGTALASRQRVAAFLRQPSHPVYRSAHQAVRAGVLDKHVVRALHRDGTAVGFLILDGAQALQRAQATAGPGEGATAAVLRVTGPAYAAQKARVFARASGVTILQDYSVLPMSLVRFRSERALLRALNDAEVAGIGANEREQPTLAQSLPLIRQPQAAAAGFTGASTAVAVLDTGVDYTRSAFGSCTAPNTPVGTCKVVVAQDFAPDDGSLDDNGHGTNVAGIVVGVAPSTKILALDVFGPGGSGSDSNIVAAINFTIANQPTFNIRAMNLSLGQHQNYNTTSCSAGSNPYVTAFANARAVMIMPVVAAGNDAFTAGNVFHNGISNPGCTPGAMSVGAVYDGNNGGLIWGTAPDTCTDATSAADQITCFSQSADFLTVLAPGAMITAAGITEGGTSQATPHVAGAVAVLAAANPTATLDTITSAIANSGPAILDARNGVTKHRFDLPDAITAVGAAPTTPAITSFAPTSGPVGTSVIITGINFTGATSVAFAGVGATFTVDSATQITATVPVGALTGTITVITPTGTGTSAAVFTVGTAAADHARSVSFFGAGGRAKGRVHVNDGFTACASRVPIKLQVKSRGRWQTADTGMTLAAGKFTATLGDGLFRAVAPRNILASGDVCLKAISPTLFR